MDSLPARNAIPRFPLCPHCWRAGCLLYGKYRTRLRTVPMQPNARRTGPFEEHRFRCSCCQEWVHPFSCFFPSFLGIRKALCSRQRVHHCTNKNTTTKFWKNLVCVHNLIRCIFAAFLYKHPANPQFFIYRHSPLLRLNAASHFYRIRRITINQFIT